MKIKIRRLIRNIFIRILLKLAALIHQLLPSPSLSFYSRDKILKVFFLFILERFRQQVVLIKLYEIFHNQKTNSGDRLQEPSIYKNLLSYRQALNGFEKSFLGVFLKWRSHYTGQLREIKRSKRMSSSINNDIKAVFLTKSWHFFDPVVRSLSLDSRITVTKCDLQDLENENIKNHKLTGSKTRYYRSLAIDQIFDFKNFALSDFQNEARNEEQACLDHKNADIYFVDWLNHNCIVSLSIIPLHKPVIVRVHSYEVFSYFAPLINYGRIDALIFISEGIKDIFLDLWGWVLPETCKVYVCSNLRSHAKYSEFLGLGNSTRAKTIGMVQYSDQVKDFKFALKIFKNLYSQDSTYRLRLAGKTFSENVNPHSTALLKELEFFPRGVVEECGYQTNISMFYNKIGFILSTSIREGSHESVIEGMLHGCVPLIRDWPLLSKVNGAARAFPNQNVYILPEQFSEFILNNSCNFEELSLRSMVAARPYFSPNLVDDYVNVLMEVVNK